MRYIFKVSGVPPVSLNKIYAGIHWSDRKKYKDDWREAMCGWHFHKDQKGNLNASNPVRFTEPVHIAYLFRQKKPMDSSNLAFMVKLIEDSLSIDQVIQDDTPKYVLSTWMVPIFAHDNSVTVVISTQDETPLTYAELLLTEPDE